MVLHIKKFYHFLVKVLCFYLMCTSYLIGQEMDFDNRKFEYNLDSLDVWKFKLDYNELLSLDNFGVNKEHTFDNYEFTGASHWRNYETINNGLGFVNEILKEKEFSISPFVFDKVFTDVSAFRFSHDYDEDVNIGLVENVIDSFIDVLKSYIDNSKPIKIHTVEMITENQLKEKKFFRGPKNIQRVLKDELNLSIFTKNKSNNTITIVPIFAQEANLETKKTTLSVEIRFYDYEDLLFMSSSMIYLPWDSFRHYSFEKNSSYYNVIADLLLHQIIFE